MINDRLEVYKGIGRQAESEIGEGTTYRPPKQSPKLGSRFPDVA